METALTFDDVLLRPKASSIDSRSNVDISTRVTPTVTIEYPFVSAPMDTVTGPVLATELARAGGIGVIPRHQEFSDIDYRASVVNDVDGQVGVAVGISADPAEIGADAARLEDNGADFICVDTAHGHLQKALDTVKEVSQAVSVDVMAGNVATAEAAQDLYFAGADAIKVGIGPGSACTTREKTGVGVPQITATRNVVQALEQRDATVITDGGMRSSGDMAKALMAGADAVMHGRLFAECKESPNDGEMYGLASDEIGGSGATEGETRQLSLQTSPVAERVEDWAESIRSTCSYCGGRTLSEARARSELIRVTPYAVDRNGVH